MCHWSDVWSLPFPVDPGTILTIRKLRVFLFLMLLLWRPLSVFFSWLRLICPLSISFFRNLGSGCLVQYSLSLLFEKLGSGCARNGPPSHPTHKKLLAFVYLSNLFSLSSFYDLVATKQGHTSEGHAQSMCT